MLGVSPYRHMSIIDLHDRVGLKSLAARRSSHLNSMVYKATHELTPLYLKRSFQFCDYSYSLRSNGNLFLPKPKTEFPKRTFLYRGAHEYNILPSVIKSSPSIFVFNKKLHSFIPSFV